MDAPRDTSSDLFAPSEFTVAGHNADVYFARGVQVLDAEGLDPEVVMEVFARRRALLCGMREVEALLHRVLSECDGEIDRLAEGNWIEPKEVVLRIRAPYRAIGLYETALLGMLSSGTGWATAAAECVEAAGEIPVISFGARHLHPDVSGRMEYAALLGGCTGCATPWGAQLAGIEASGTLPHALILVMGDTLKAAEAFDRAIDEAVTRIVLVDTFTDEADESVRVARALGERLWGVRLDRPSELGGVTPELVQDVRGRLDGEGFTHVRIVVSGGLDAERIRGFVGASAAVDAFGVGSAISGARAIDFTADVKQVDGRAVAKRGRTPGITDSARLEVLEV